MGEIGFIKNIEHKGNYSYLESSVGVFTYEIASSQKLAQPAVLPFYTRSKTLIPLKINGFEVIPYGEQNNYPEELQIILEDNNLTSEILRKKTFLLWGQSPALYKVEFKNGVKSRYWDEEKTIQAWLNSWDYIDYLQKSVVEFCHVEGHFTKFYRNLGARIGKAATITELKHVSSLYSRLEWYDSNQNINNIIVGDYRQPWKDGLRSFPVWNYRDPFANPVSMRYSNLYNFAMDNDYSRASFHGTMNWIKLSSSIPILLSNFNINSAAIKWHIESPAVYWAQKKEALMKKCEESDPQIEYKDEMLDNLKDEVYGAIANALTGVEKAGKFITTESIFDDLGSDYVGWKITPLDQKVKDFIDAQINISKAAAFETSAGLGLHPALSNISQDGNLPSGSEQLYAFKLYLMTGIELPELIICKDINDAIAVNFPGTPYRMGFYHDAVITEAQTSPQDRVKNKGSQVNSFRKSDQQNN